ncbi:hypothetical protein AB0M71_43625 [Amycolatopsis sp. NPDC051114]|uniref:hypothetical protein n=1 Tax=Amycolatopsis sp. NPDC051114 TaxID=3155280 RepID=UPI0034201A72
MTRTLRPHPGLDIPLVDTGRGDRTVLVLHGGAGPRGVEPIVEHFAPHASRRRPRRAGAGCRPGP